MPERTLKEQLRDMTLDRDDWKARYRKLRKVTHEAHAKADTIEEQMSELRLLLRR